MSNQDYISRTPSKKKASARKKQSSTPENQAISVKTKIIVVLVLFLVPAFVYSLWSLKTAPQTKTPLVENTTSKTNNTKVLPKPPKEKWTYVKDLENKEVEVGKYQIKQNGPYKMQCGSFKTTHKAEVLKAQIAFTGLEAQVQSAKGKSRTWYKVVLGPYPNKRLAEKDKNKLKKNNINYCQIWLWK